MTSYVCMYVKLGYVRLENVYFSTETSTVPGGRCDPFLKRKDNRGHRKIIEEVGKREWEAEELHRPKSKQNKTNATTLMKP